MGRLWRKQSLDALLVMTYAPGQSKFNPIERQWAPRSRDLSGLVLPACLPGEDKPPPQQSGLSEEQRMQKQKAVHKAAISRLCSIWNGRTYDGHPVAALAVEHPNDDGLDSGLDKEHQKIDEVAEAGGQKCCKRLEAPIWTSVDDEAHHGLALSLGDVGDLLQVFAMRQSRRPACQSFPPSFRLN